MKTLSGSELADYIKQRQSKEVRRLKQAHQIYPALAVVQDHPNRLIDTYVRIKRKYALDIGIETEVFLVKPGELRSTVLRLNQDDKYHGIIVQLPLSDLGLTDEIVDLIEPTKDVDGLNAQSLYTPATAQAILWLLTGYDVKLEAKQVVVVGRGRLVGAPLVKLMQENAIKPEVLDETSTNFAQTLSNADVIISAAGQPGLVKSAMVKAGAVVVDAGTSSEGGVIRGDVADELYDRTDVIITPKRGGVGPLTVASLFDNLLRAARVRITAP